MQVRPILRFLGILLVGLGLAQLLPLICALVYGEVVDARAFVLSALVAVGLGTAGILAGSRVAEVLRREAVVIVVGAWVLASLLGALPFLLSGSIAQPLDAFFESASGFTTTGATILTDIEALGRGILFWRSMTQWLGGMGIIVLFVALLPELGPGARFLYKLEVPGPADRALRPRIRDTALTLWTIYLGLSAAQTVLLMVAGLSLYDAVTATFSTVSTGGFSPHADSIASFSSPLVELIVVFFMLAGGTNFSLYYLMRIKGRGVLFRDSEVRLYLSIVVAATLLIAAHLLFDGFGGPLEALRAALFQVASIGTTTGFATADYALWPVFPQLLLVALMFSGACAGSTSGSMKVMRMAIGLRSAFRQVQLLFNPHAVLPIFVGGRPVPEPVVQSVAGFFIIFLSAWGMSSLVLTFSGHDLATAASAAVACLGNVGPGIAGVGPWENYAFFASWEKLLLVFLMWLGRLELYAVLALFVRRFWLRG